MTPNLQSKFSIKHVIIEPIVIVILVSILGTIVVFVALNMMEEGTSFYKTPIWVLPLFLLLLFSSFRYYSKIFRRYTFFDRGFEVRNIYGKKFHSWSSVKELSIIQSRYEKILWQYMNEDALCIQLEDGNILELFSKYYRNMPEIRQLLSSKNNLVITDAYDDYNEEVKKFPKKSTIKGIFTSNIEGLTIVGILFIYTIITLMRWSSITPFGYVIIFMFPIIMLFFFGFLFYYFQLDQNYLIIRNQIFFHVKHRVELNNIRVIYFEQKFRKGPSIRIIDKNYNVKSFQSVSLREKHWKLLISNLKNQNIKVVDNLYYDYDE